MSVPQSGALYPASPSQFATLIRLDDDCQAEIDRGDAELRLLQWTARPSSEELACRSEGGPMSQDASSSAREVEDGTRAYDLSEPMVDGIYCLRLERGDRRLASIPFKVVAGEPILVDSVLDDLQVRADLRTRVSESLGHGLIISDGRNDDRVRVRWPAAPLVKEAARYQTVVAEEHSKPPPSHAAAVYEAVARFRFCCGSDRLFDEPVANHNRDALDWFKAQRRRLRGQAVTVMGYASTPGSCALNESLSRRRAAAVARALRARRIRVEEVQWCGETGPANNDSIVVGSTSAWQRVDVHLPPTVFAARLSRRAPDGELLPLDPGSRIEIRSESGTSCSVVVEDERRTADLAIVIDTSGSMLDDWNRFIAPRLGREATRLTEQLAARGIDVRVHVYTLADDFCAQLEQSQNITCSSLPADQLVPCSQGEANESWGPATSWIARIHAWRPGALRAIMPMSDELPCEGSLVDDGADTRSLDDAVATSKRLGVMVIPFAGVGSDGIVTSMFARLAGQTGGQTGSLAELGQRPFERVLTAIEQALSRASRPTLLYCSRPDDADRVRIEVAEPKGGTAWTHDLSLSSVDRASARNRDIPDCRERRACLLSDDDPPVSPDVSREPRLECSAR